VPLRQGGLQGLALQGDLHFASSSFALISALRYQVSSSMALIGTGQASPKRLVTMMYSSTPSTSVTSPTTVSVMSCRVYTTLIRCPTWMVPLLMSLAPFLLVVFQGVHPELAVVPVPDAAFGVVVEPGLCLVNDVV